jgi:hypothetical protein
MNVSVGADCFAGKTFSNISFFQKNPMTLMIKFARKSIVGWKGANVWYCAYIPHHGR